jgi:phosphate acetyltransferase
MSNNLFVTATEPKSGKSVICLGLMELLFRKVEKVGFFRPVIPDPSGNKKDNDIDLIASHFKLQTPYEKMYAYTMSQAENMLSQGRQAELIEGIVDCYNEISKEHDFVLCEGIEIKGSGASFEFVVNAKLSENLGSPVLLVANAHNKTIEETVRVVNYYNKSFLSRGCNVIATVVNRVEADKKKDLIKCLKGEDDLKGQQVYSIPDDKSLGNPTVGEIVDIINAKVLFGEKHLNQHVHSYTVAAMRLDNFLRRIQHGTLVITPGDRSDVIVGCLSAISSMSMPYISGILLTGGLVPEEPVQKLIEGSRRIISILSVSGDTFSTATKIDNMHAGIRPEDKKKINYALGYFEKNIDMEALGKKIIRAHSTIVTPKMFEFRLIQMAKKNKKHIVLPEGEDERILRAAKGLLDRDVVDITLLGDEKRIRGRMIRFGLTMNTANIVEPKKSACFEEYVHTFFTMRGGKGVTEDMARDAMTDVSYFGTMMVHKGQADGMVSGAVHTTGDTIRPAFQIIKTTPDCAIVSSVIFMCLRDKVLVYGDCAVNPNPNAGELAEIAISSALTAQRFGVEPRVAMLSYSTGESGKGADVDIVKKATEIAREKAKTIYPDLKLEGPIQYDAAVDIHVAETKMPGSDVAGNATVLIFPDLNTGNNTYKAVQRSSGAVAVGPILQGLRKPVNDLSRGCTVADIINTAAITAIQAQNETS